MAISPAQARAGNLSKLSDDERQQLERLEEQIDRRLIQAFTDHPDSLLVSLGIDDFPTSSLTPAMIETLKARYKALGWGNVRVTESETNYSVQFDL